MPFTKVKCERCGKDAESVDQVQTSEGLVHLLKCGHLLIKDSIQQLEVVRSLAMKWDWGKRSKR